jgi:hypothetical protein
METVFMKKSENIKINTEGEEEQKKPGQKKSQLTQLPILITVLSSARQQPHLTLRQI